MINELNAPAVLGPVERPVRPAVAVAHRSDEHLALLGAPYHWNLLTGVDRADMLAFGRACMEAEREHICRAIKAEDDHCAGHDYMLDSDDCINVARGQWVRDT